MVTFAEIIENDCIKERYSPPQMKAKVWSILNFNRRFC